MQIDDRGKTLMQKSSSLESLGKGLSPVIERVSGLHVVVVSGGDGVILLKYPDEPVIEGSASIGTLESAFAIAADQVAQALWK